MQKINQIAKPVLFIVCLVPFLILIQWIWRDQLGANPVETITHFTGEWALRFLLLTLAITPLRRISGWIWLQRLRRMLGLFAFFYACLHFSIWLVFDHFFDWETILEDVVERPYITVGFTAFLLLIPLAATSTDGMMRRLKRHWRRLHKLVYLIAVLAVLHFLWLVKSDITEPLLYAGLLGILLGYRLWYSSRRQTAPRSAVSTASVRQG